MMSDDTLEFSHRFRDNAGNVYDSYEEAFPSPNREGDDDGAPPSVQRMHLERLQGTLCRNTTTEKREVIEEELDLGQTPLLHTHEIDERSHSYRTRYIGHETTINKTHEQPLPDMNTELSRGLYRGERSDCALE